MITLACTVSQKSGTKNLIIQSIEKRKWNKYREEYAGEGRFTIRQYNTSLSTCLPNMSTQACRISQKSLTKNFNYSKYGKKENRTNTEKISTRRLVCNPTIQYIVINLHTKYNYSSLHRFTKMFDKMLIIQNMERKKIKQIQKRTSMRRLVRNPTIQYIIIKPHTKYDYSSLHSFTENFYHPNYGKKENQTNTGKDKQEKAGSQSYDTIHHHQLAYQI